MAIIIGKETEFKSEANEKFGLKCPYCDIYAYMSPQSVPSFNALTQTRPKHAGLVFECDACRAPVFLRFAVQTYAEDKIELSPNFTELERPRERFNFSYLPEETGLLFSEALSCYSNNNFNAFASMCRRSSATAFLVMDKNEKLRAFDELLAAQKIANIDDATFGPIKDIIFSAGEGNDLPIVNRAQAGILLEALKDTFYQCFVRPGKLNRAIKVRQVFSQDDDQIQSSA